MNDTCATHRSRVPRRSFGRNKRRSDDSGRRERTRPGFYFMFCVRQSSARGCRFSVMFGYFVIKMFKCSPVPASFFPYIRTALQICSLTLLPFLLALFVQLLGHTGHFTAKLHLYLLFGMNPTLHPACVLMTCIVYCILFVFSCTVLYYIIYGMLHCTVL